MILDISVELSVATHFLAGDKKHCHNGSCGIVGPHPPKVKKSNASSFVWTVVNAIRQLARHSLEEDLSQHGRSKIKSFINFT